MEKTDYKQLANTYQAENFLLATENDTLMAPVLKSFEISLLISEMISETLLFAMDKGYSQKIRDRLGRLEKISEFVSSYDNLSFNLNRHRQHLKVVAYQREQMRIENATLKAKLEKYEKWEKEHEQDR